MIVQDTNTPRTLAASALAAAAGVSRSLSATGAGHDETIPRTFVALLDVLAVLAAFLTAVSVAPWIQWLLIAGALTPDWLVVPGSPSFDQFPSMQSLLWVLTPTLPLTLFFMELFGGYRQLADQSRARVLISSTLSPLVALSFLTLLLFALKATDSGSRVVIFTFAMLNVLILFSYRTALRSYKRRRLEAGTYAKNVVLVGNPSAVQWLAAHFRDTVPHNRYQVAGWLTVESRQDADPAGLPSLGEVEVLGQLLINSPIHEVIAVQSSTGRDWLRKVIEDCDYYRIRLRIVPEALLVGNLRDLKLMFRTDPLRLPEVVLDPPHLESDALFIKRVIDIMVSATLLVLLVPVFVLVAIAIKVTTPQLPILYPWRVIGLKGRAFTGYKFTTMVADADELKSTLQARNEMKGPVFKLKDDPRVTPIGKFLRKYSLNELPQLWSVLRGDMSLVGPRPAFRHELDRYELWQKRKLCVKPGITCLWQVNGRNQISNFDDWVRLDLQYIDEWSLWLDIRILIRTARAVFSGTGS